MDNTVKVVEIDHFREKLIELLCETHKCIDPSDTVKEHYSYVADCLISNDVVPVVRCKGCKQWSRNSGIAERPNGHCFYNCLDTNGHDFCSYGERDSNIDKTE